MKRRRFLKTAGGGLVYFGSGLFGVPVGLGGCNDDKILLGGGDAGSEDTLDAAVRQDARDRDDTWLREVSDTLGMEVEEMTPDEAADFVAEIDQAAADLRNEMDADGNPLVPPGQHVVESMPVMARHEDPRTAAEWRLTVSGEVGNPLDLSWEQFSALPHVDVVKSVHCVTGWTMLNVEWRGVRVSHLMELAEVTDNGRFLVFDSETGYTTNIDIEEIQKPYVLVADGLSGGSLPGEYGGLARGLIPDRYFYKSAKWVTGIRVLAEDEPGFWERRGYSNTADPWTEDRY